MANKTRKSKFTINEKKALITKASKNVNNEIKNYINRDSLFSRGLASEGYNGGYRDALNDITLLLNGVVPNRNHWWDNE